MERGNPGNVFFFRQLAGNAAHAWAGALLLPGAYVLDHPQTLRSVERIRITLDGIGAHALFEPAATRAELSRRLGVEVAYCPIISVDDANNTARIDVHYRTRPQGTT